jgi:CheY-like chemotaxis protein
MNRLPALSSETIAELAHELRSPLGGIEAMADLLAQSGLNADQARMIEALRSSAAHLRAIADRALGAKGKPLVETPKALGALIEPLAASAEARGKTRGVQFRLIVDDELRWQLVEDPLAFRQVLENLIDNAVRLTPEGEIALEIVQAGQRFDIVVRDSGPGIAPEDAARIIATGGSIAGRLGGAGIGLAISGKLVARHAGVLTGGSRGDSSGSEFRFDWPIARPVSQGLPCLIVDDHPASRLVLGTILRAFGLAPHEAGTLVEAREALARNRFSLVITDLRLGEEDGRDLLHELAAQPDMVGVKRIIVSADELDPDCDCRGLIDGAIQKPISVRAIAALLADAGVAISSEANAA